MRNFLGVILLAFLLAPAEAAPTGPVSVFFDGKWTGEAFADKKTIAHVRRVLRRLENA